MRAASESKTIPSSDAWNAEPGTALAENPALRRWDGAASALPLRAGELALTHGLPWLCAAVPELVVLFLRLRVGAGLVELIVEVEIQVVRLAPVRTDVHRRQVR